MSDYNMISSDALSSYHGIISANWCSGESEQCTQLAKLNGVLFSKRENLII